MLRSNIPSNVGNGFFYLGLEHSLLRAIPDANIIYAPFPAQNPFGLSDAQFRQSFQLQDHLDDYDVLVIAGPVLDQDFPYHFGHIMRAAKRAGKQIWLLSCGARKYDTAEFDACSELLADVQPDLFQSRDGDTFSAYARFAARAYDGVCFAFYVSEFLENKVLAVDRQYCTVCLDFTHEPNLEKSVQYRGGRAPKLQRQFAPPRTTSAYSKFRMLAQRNLPSTFSNLLVVRPSHRPIRHSRHIFHKCNSFADYEPQSYLHLYANTEFTLTDRLHAAVATLAFGRPAHLALRSNRVRLLDSAGCGDALSGFVCANLDQLGEMKERQLDWLRSAI